MFEYFIEERKKESESCLEMISEYEKLKFLLRYDSGNEFFRRRISELETKLMIRL